MSAKLVDNSSPLSLLTVLKPGGSSCFSADSKPPKSVGAYTYLNRIVLQKKSTKNIRNTLKECLKLKNGNVQEFVDHIYYGDELWFRYKGRLYFLEGWSNENHLDLKLYEMRENGKEYSWKGDNKKYPVDEFINAKIWNDKTFWQVEQDIEWVDDDAS